MNKYKICGFTQARNESEKGNLLNWLRCMDMCDLIYIYDQNSTDNSREIYESNPKCRVIYSPTNDFKNENLCKGRLLNKLLQEQPDASWILWADVDYIFSNNILKDNFAGFFKLIEDAERDGFEALAFGHYNLWRSDTYYRVDDNFHISHANGRISLWKNNGRLQIPSVPGLHQSPQPVGLGRSRRVDADLIHRGFATDYQIMTKYDVYKAHGQHGWDLDRLLSERGLSVERLPDGLLPEWFELTDDVDPRTKTLISDIYHNR